MRADAGPCRVTLKGCQEEFSCAETALRAGPTCGTGWRDGPIPTAWPHPHGTVSSPQPGPILTVRPHRHSLATASPQPHGLAPSARRRRAVPPRAPLAPQPSGPQRPRAAAGPRARRDPAAPLQGRAGRSPGATALSPRISNASSPVSQRSGELSLKGSSWKPLLQKEKKILHRPLAAGARG